MSKAPTGNPVLLLGGKPHKLTWDRGAMFLADELGVFSSAKPGLGLARAAKYVFVMLTDEARDRFGTPRELAKHLPPLSETWPAINAAIIAGGPETNPKNVVGSTSGPSQSSS